jgi:phosphoribosyl 1,2-cyclic phosphate phosphodiesterase
METPKLLVLVSAAAEGVPALFCDCRVCREAAANGGPDVRARACYNFGGDVQIDFGPDALQAWQAHRDVLRKMRHVLVTHAHEDHLQPSDLLYHSRGFAGVPALDAVLTIHGTAPTRRRIEREFWLGNGESLESKFAKCDLAFHEFRQFDAFELADCGAVVRTFAADHWDELEPCVFLVTLRGRTAFVCNDTGWLPDASWNALAKLKGEVAIDVAVLDDTGMLKGAPEGPEGSEAWHRGHMSAPTILRAFDKLDALGLLAPGCVRAVNHFSHNGGSTHGELRAFWEPRGISVGFDGLEL